MTIQRKLRFGYYGLAVIVVVLVAVGVSILLWLGSWKAQYSGAVKQVEYANELVANEASMLDYVLLPLFDSFGEKQSQYASQLDHYTKAANDALAGARGAETKSADMAALTSLSTLFASYEKSIGDVMTLAKTMPAQAGVKASEEVLPMAKQIESAAASFKQSKVTEQSLLLQSLDQREKILLIVMSVLGFAAFVAALVIAALLSRIIARQLRAAVSGISASATELLAVASQVAAGAAQTAASATETTATVEEVKQTALLAHEKAAQVAQNSQNLASAAEAGRSTVEETIVGFDRISDQMTVMSDTIDRLGEQTQAVGDIIATVSDLAEQSNLLSVNASIEAAKAGEQGKGFNVVAQEVKALAEQSKQAVAQVRTILGEIQRASAVAVQAARQGRETVSVGRQQSLESGESVQVITDNANEAAQSALQISASSRQQLVGMEQISQAIASISQAGAQSAAGTRQVEQEVRQLQDLAARLRQLVGATAAENSAREAGALEAGAGA